MVKTITRDMFSWRAPRAILRLPDEYREQAREMYNILVEGEDIPPPLFRFEVRVSQRNHH